MAGGLLGLITAFQGERAGGILVPWVLAPVIEEVSKPIGVYVALIRWPGSVQKQVYIALLAALGGICFALVESTIYMKLYFPEHTQSELVFRFTVPVLVHAVASFIFGLGINRQLFVTLASGGALPLRSLPFFLAAIALHGGYNIAVSVLEIVEAI